MKNRKKKRYQLVIYEDLEDNGIDSPEKIVRIEVWKNGYMVDKHFEEYLQYDTDIMYEEEQEGYLIARREDISSLEVALDLFQAGWNVLIINKTLSNL